MLTAFLLAMIGSAHAQDAAQAPAPEVESMPPRATLTDDWGGAGSRWKEQGVSLSLDTTHFYQGMLSGNGRDDFEYGGRVDAMLNLDTGKLGWWDGGGFRTHFEYRFGEASPFRGGALWPVNTALLLPLGDKQEIVASSFYLTQKLGPKTLLMLGKINAVDLLAGDPFFGGWGTTRFMNIAFVAPPSGVVPPTLMGAVISHQTQPVSYTFMVFDPEDRTNDYFPDNLFETGVNLSVGATWTGQWGGRASNAGITVTYSTADGTDFANIGLPPGLQGGTKTDSYNVAVSLSHILVAAPGKPNKGLGLYAKAANADGNPNVVQNSFIGGIAGHEIVPGRPRDSFGIGYFFYDFSDVLQDTVATEIGFNDEQGLELFYNAALTPWLRLTADLQWADPASADYDRQWVAALRMQVIF